MFKRFNFIKANWELFKQLLPTSLPAEYGSNINKIDEFIVNSLNKAAVKSIPVFCQTKNNKKLPKYILELINARKKARKVSKNDSKKDYHFQTEKLTKTEQNYNELESHYHHYGIYRHQQS